MSAKKQCTKQHKTPARIEADRAQDILTAWMATRLDEVKTDLSDANRIVNQLEERNATLFSDNRQLSAQVAQNFNIMQAMDDHYFALFNFTWRVINETPELRDRHMAEFNRIAVEENNQIIDLTADEELDEDEVEL